MRSLRAAWLGPRRLLGDGVKAQLRNVDDHGVHYTALMFCCPGCAEMSSNTGLHMVAVNSPQKVAVVGLG